MWLLRLHFAISVLCLLTFVGFKHVMKDAIKENGYTSDDKKKKGVLSYWIFFIPIMNILVIIMLFVMISTKKNDLNKWVEEHKKKEDEN